MDTGFWSDSDDIASALDAGACKGKLPGEACAVTSDGVCGICSEGLSGTADLVCLQRDCDLGCDYSTHTCYDCDDSGENGCLSCHYCDGGHCTPRSCTHGCDEKNDRCYECDASGGCGACGACSGGYCATPASCAKFGCSGVVDEKTGKAKCFECETDGDCSGCATCNHGADGEHGRFGFCEEPELCKAFGCGTVSDPETGKPVRRCMECKAGDTRNSGCQRCVGGFWAAAGEVPCDPGDGGCGVCTADGGTCAARDCSLGCDASTHRCWECDSASVDRCRTCDLKTHEWVDNPDGAVECGTCSGGVFTAVDGDAAGCSYCEGGELKVHRNWTESRGCRSCDAVGQLASKPDGTECAVCHACRAGTCTPLTGSPADGNPCVECDEGYPHTTRFDDTTHSWNGKCVVCASGDPVDVSDYADACFECVDGAVVTHAGADCDGTVDSTLSDIGFKCGACTADGWCAPKTSDNAACPDGEEFDEETCTCAPAGCRGDDGESKCGPCEKCSAGKCVADSGKNGAVECGTCSGGVFTAVEDGTAADGCNVCVGGVKTKRPDGTTPYGMELPDSSCHRCVGGVDQPITGPVPGLSDRCTACAAGKFVTVNEGGSCSDSDKCRVCKAGSCTAVEDGAVECGTCSGGVFTAVEDGTAFGKCNVCQGGRKQAVGDGEVECGTCSGGDFTPKSGALDACSDCVAGVKTARKSGTACGECSWCVDGECTPVADGTEFDACNTCRGGKKTPKAYGTACGDGCGICTAGGVCEEDTSMSGRQVGDTCRVCRAGVPVPDDSLCEGDCRQCGSDGACGNRPDGALNKCSACAGGVKVVSAVGAVECGSCDSFGNFTPGDDHDIDKCTGCRGGAKVNVNDGTVFSDCTACVDGEQFDWDGDDMCGDCSTGTLVAKNEGAACARGDAVCGVCAGGNCVRKACPAGQELDTETCECGECTFGVDPSTGACNECDPDSSGQSACPPCRKCAAGKCVADPNATPDCGTCEDGTFTPATGAFDACNDCVAGVKTAKAEGTAVGSCRVCYGGELSDRADGSSCGTCRTCSGGTCVADTSLDETRVGETCSYCSGGELKDNDDWCGPCERCSAGKCVADSGKNGAVSGSTPTGDTRCGTCSDGVFSADSSVCGACRTCSAAGVCEPSGEQDGSPCGDCGKCAGGTCFPDPDLAGTACSDGCGTCGADGYCRADSSMESKPCGDGCSSCQDGKCLVDSALDGSACGAGGCGRCDGGRCGADGEKDGKAACNGGCGRCSGIGCEADASMEGRDCNDGCGACHSGLCMAKSGMEGRDLDLCNTCEGGVKTPRPDGRLSGDDACGHCIRGAHVRDDADCGKCGTCSETGRCRADDSKCGKCETCSADAGYSCVSACAGVTCSGCADCDPCTGGCTCAGPGKCEVRNADGTTECRCDSRYDCGCGTAICGTDECDCGTDKAACAADGYGGCVVPDCSTHDCGPCGSAYVAADGNCACDCSGSLACEPDGSGGCRVSDCALAWEQVCGPCGVGVSDGKGGCRCDCSATDCLADGRSCKWAPCADPSLDCGCGWQVRDDGGKCVCRCGGACRTETADADGTVHHVQTACTAAEGGGCTCSAPEPPADDPKPSDEQTPVDDDGDKDDDPCEGKDCGCGKCVAGDCACGSGGTNCVRSGGTCISREDDPCMNKDCGDCGIGVSDGKGGCKCSCDTGGCVDGADGRCRKLTGCRSDAECAPQVCDTLYRNGLGRCVDCTKAEQCQEKCGGSCDTERGVCRPAECAAGERCSPETGCYVCKRASECSSGICDALANDGKGACVKCTPDDTSKCPSACDTCDSGACKGTCQAGETCNEGEGRCEDDGCAGKQDGYACGDCRACSAGRCVSSCESGQACVAGSDGKMRCGGCTADTECQAAGTPCAKCDTETGECMECQGGRRCVADGAGGHVCGTCAADRECGTSDSECLGCVLTAAGTTECGPDDALCPVGFTCSAAGKCMECAGDKDCTDSSRPYCNDGKCTACHDDSQCISGQVCKAGVGCVDCKVDADCAKVNACATCDPSTNTCRDICGEQGKECQESRKMCVECLGDATCKEKGSCLGCDEFECRPRAECSTGVCDDDYNCITCGLLVGAHVNAGCSVSNCETCEDGECVSSCRQDEHCDGDGKCWPCTENSHCGPGKSCIDHQCVECSEAVPCQDVCHECVGGVCTPKTCPSGTTCSRELGGECAECDTVDQCVGSGLGLSCARCSGGRCTNDCPYGAECTSTGCRGDKECDSPADCAGSPCDAASHKCLRGAECAVPGEDCPANCYVCSQDLKCVPKDCPGGCNSTTGNCNCENKPKTRPCGVCGAWNAATCGCECYGVSPVTGAQCVSRGRSCRWDLSRYSYWEGDIGGWDGPAEEIV